jgi:hypothetical protein
VPDPSEQPPKPAPPKTLREALAQAKEEADKIADQKWKERERERQAREEARAKSVPPKAQQGPWQKAFSSLTPKASVKGNKRYPEEISPQRLHQKPKV